MSAVMRPSVGGPGAAPMSPVTCAGDNPRSAAHAAMPVARPRRDLTGERFGRLVVLGDPRQRKVGRRHLLTVWWCRCECGAELSAQGQDMVRGNTRSCGCLARDTHTTHGKSNEHRPTYRSWNAMRTRTTNPNHPGFASYGAVGVTCCDAWADFAAFLADMGERPEGTTLDRYHPDWKPGDPPLPYSPETCRWATTEEQQNNRRDNVFLEHAGRRQTIAQWARESGLSAVVLVDRLARGWPIEDALSRRPGDSPFPKKGRRIRFRGESLTVSDWEARLGFRHGTVRQRLGKLGWSVERALTTPVAGGAR